MILLDTSGVLAAVRARDINHLRARTALLAAQPPLVLSPFVLAELDYMISRDLGRQAELRFLADVASGAYTLAPFSNRDVGTARMVVERCADLDVGLADASIVVLSSLYSTGDVLTFDRRHFRALRRLDGAPFRLLPEDAQ